MTKFRTQRFIQSSRNLGAQKKNPEKIRKIQKIRYSFHVDFVMIDEEIDEMKPYIVVQSRHLAQASTEKRCKDSQIEVD